MKRKKINIQLFDIKKRNPLFIQSSFGKKLITDTKALLDGFIRRLRIQSSGFLKYFAQTHLNT